MHHDGLDGGADQGLGPALLLTPAVFCGSIGKVGTAFPIRYREGYRLAGAIHCRACHGPQEEEEEAMIIAGIEFPEDLYYDRQHNWARLEGDLVVQGMTEFGQQIAQEIVFVEMPRAGREVEQGETFMSMESGKWVGRIPAAVTGKILEANEELEWEPMLVNESPYDEGWLVRIEMADPSGLDNLLKADSPEFKAFIEEEAEEYKEILE